MRDIGHFALVLSWAFALGGMILGGIAGYRKDAILTESVRRITILVAALSFLSLVGLSLCFLNNDYSIQYVWQFSNRDMSPMYKVSAVWGGMDGSMLLWAAMLAFGGAIVALTASRCPRLLTPWLLAVINSSSLFFLTIVTFLTNPFRGIRADFIPTDGNGLNPLLQNPLMVIHPPMLYAGFTSFAIPYAFCIAALLSGVLTNDWIRLTRRWTLIAWGFLTMGIILGGHWAYVELGWGGYWAWDPVENASFLPWLTGTAFLHSVMVQERKNMLKLWNVWLVVATYGLTVFGTFLTRSGIVESVHAFASTDIGWIFIVYLVGVVALTVALTWYRRTELRSERQIESFLSREAAFLLNNLMLLSICFATLWGVMWPVISEGIFGQKQAVGIPFFEAVNIPLFLFLLFLMGVGPLIAWRQATLSSVVKTFGTPFVVGILGSCLSLWIGVRSFLPVVSYGLCAFVAATIFGEFHRGMKVVRHSVSETPGVAASFRALFQRHRARYGGYVVHLGVVVMAIAITASMAHKIEKDFTLSKGERFEVGRFSLLLRDISGYRTGNYEALTADVAVYHTNGAESIGTLTPEKRFYLRSQEQTSEVALRVGVREDVYLALAGIDESGTRATFKVFVNPLQVWVWIGAIVMVIGTVIVLVPVRREAAIESRETPEVKAGA